MELLLLARHGESEYSARGLVNSDPSVEVALTPAGVEQALELGRTLAATAVDLCVTSELWRTRQTAELALAGRDVPVETWADLNELQAGEYEGRALEEYRPWAWAAGSAEPIPGASESRLAAVERYTRAYRALLERPEAAVLAVAHGLPIAYLLGALEGRAPAARMDRPIEYARAYPADAHALAGAVAVLEGWCAAPDW